MCGARFLSCGGRLPEIEQQGMAMKTDAVVNDAVSPDGSECSSSRDRQLQGDEHRLTNQVNLGVLTARFRNALGKGVEGIIEAGRVLIEAKGKLKHGQF